MRKFIHILSFMTLLCSGAFAHADSTFVNRPDVQSFINTMVTKHDFKRDEMTALMNHVKTRKQILLQVRKPLEIEPWRTYQMLFVNEWRIKHGVEFWKLHEDTLKKAEKQYGVPASIIVATVGVETKYGQRMGDYRVIDSLSSLAFDDSRRAPFFRSELEQFLLLAREQHMDPLTIEGSYAGALGQPQFMPSSYRAYAVNFSGSGKTDLMNDPVDVIGSVANYYHKHGWKKGEPVATQALTIGNRYNYLQKKNKIKQPLHLKEWAKYGVIPKNKIKHTPEKLRVIELPSRFSKEYWLGYPNFKVIKSYNSSDLYAMAVYQLSEYITSLKENRNSR